MSADDGRHIALHLSQYVVQLQGKEVVNVQNRLDGREFRHWRIAKRTTREVVVNNKHLQLMELVLKGPSQELLVWHWYRVGDYYIKDKYSAKFSEVKARLFDGRRDAAIITIATPINGSRDIDQETDAAGQSLTRFLVTSMSAIEDSLDRVAGKAR
jgi:EpsI family protein